MCRHLDHCQAVNSVNSHLLLIQTVDILVIVRWLMVAETCSGNWIKDVIVCSVMCRFGRFLGKILVALKKLFFSTIPDFKHMQHRYPGYVLVYYIYLGIHARSLLML